jgi:carbamoyl-phosphate synthase large subunit
MNILVLSCGSRNKIVQYIKKALNGKGLIIAADCSEIAPALYEADRYYIVPRITVDGYLDEIYGICRKESIAGVISLIDPELSVLAKHSQVFESLGVMVIGSNYDLCERSIDKYEMYLWMSSHGYKCAKSYLDPLEFNMAVVNGEISFPVFVKPARGSASISISRADDHDAIDFLCRNNNEMMIQEFLNGQEIGADVYIDMISGEVVSIFTKEKIMMKAGETDKAISFKDPKLFDLIELFVKESGFKGQIDIDLFRNDGEYYISEVNPRFGGGYPHAHECGVDHMTMLMNNMKGIVNEKHIGEYDEGVYMMKYNEIIIRRS